MRDPCPAHEAEAAQRLRAALALYYMSLRRVMAQAAGLVLLSTSRRSETQDGIAVTLAALRLDCAEAAEGIVCATRLLGRESLSQHRLHSAASLIAEALSAMERAIRPSRQGMDIAGARPGDAIRLLDRARRLMASVADERAGLVMVGLSHACCCHGGQATRRFAEPA